MLDDFDTDDFLEYGALAAGTTIPAYMAYNAMSTTEDSPCSSWPYKAVVTAAVAAPSYMATKYLVSYVKGRKSGKKKKVKKSGKKKRRKSSNKW